MKAKELVGRLSDALSAFVPHVLLMEELLKELKHTGKEAQFLRILLARLKYLLENGREAIRHKEFEQINDSIYSMHISSSCFNIRILYGFLPDGRTALLLAFYEREGHSDTSYEKYIGAAGRRLKELEEEQL